VLRRHVERELMGPLRCRVLRRVLDGKRYGTARLQRSTVEHTERRCRWM